MNMRHLVVVRGYALAVRICFSLVSLALHDELPDKHNCYRTLRTCRIVLRDGKTDAKLSGYPKAGRRGDSEKHWGRSLAATTWGHATIAGR